MISVVRQAGRPTTTDPVGPTLEFPRSGTCAVDSWVRWALQLAGLQQRIDAIVECLLISYVHVDVMGTTGVGTPREPALGVEVCRTSLTELVKNCCLPPTA